MPDKEVILKSLWKVERRIRANRFYADFSRTFSLFLTILVALKIWDLRYPFRAATVILSIGLWLVAVLAYLVWLLRQKGTLAQAAASIDNRLRLFDEIKTAYWFITNPVTSPWVDGQIQRAATSARRLDVDRLYPRVLPSSSYLAAGLLFLIVGLNFSSLSLNHNWFALEAAPAYTLGAIEQELFKEAEELLLKIKHPDAAQKLRQAMTDLQAGKMDSNEAIQRLGELRQMLEDGKLDLDSINSGLEEIARDLAQSRQLRAAAELLSDRALPESAREVRLVAAKIETVSSSDLNEMRESLDKASRHARPGLEELSEHLKAAATTLQDEDHQRSRDALVHIAQDIEQLALQIEIQQLTDDAGEALQNLAEIIRLRQQVESGEESAGPGAGWTSPLPDGRLGPDGSPPGNEAHGLEPSGEAVSNARREGRPTSLKIQLRQERLRGQHDEGIPDDAKEATKQERSGFDYSDVTTEHRFSRKDVVNQNNIPREHRPLIKDYFELIHD